MPSSMTDYSVGAEEGFLYTIGQLVMHCFMKSLLLLPGTVFKAYILTLKLVYFVFYLLN